MMGSCNKKISFFCCFFINSVSVSLSPRENIQIDIGAWESSGQWVFSCYSNAKYCLSGQYYYEFNNMICFVIIRTVDLKIFLLFRFH